MLLAQRKYLSNVHYVYLIALIMISVLVFITLYIFTHLLFICHHTSAAMQNLRLSPAPSGLSSWATINTCKVWWSFYHILSIILYFRNSAFPTCPHWSLPVRISLFPHCIPSPEATGFCSPASSPSKASGRLPKLPNSMSSVSSHPPWSPRLGSFLLSCLPETFSLPGRADTELSGSPPASPLALPQWALSLNCLLLGCGLQYSQSY